MSEGKAKRTMWNAQVSGWSALIEDGKDAHRGTGRYKRGEARDQAWIHAG
ncbi:MAG: hypothetical protein SWK76_15415 [Actinomycetota bacterium]|nr:hypothetical protein [Actinomycetota bacterium]